MVIPQHLLRLLHGSAHGIPSGIGVEIENPVVDLHIPDISGIHPADAGGRLQHNLQGFLPFDTFQRPRHPEGKPIVIDRFQDKIQGSHGISLDSILGHVGNKHNDHVLIPLTDRSRRLHTVHFLHFNIEENDVKDMLPVLHDLPAILVHHNLKGQMMLFSVFFNVIPDLFPITGFILHNCHSIHLIPFVHRRHIRT